ncbi:hypothetical protein CPB86DRAFT_796836 [Serendipita vermifera]|nr:hypothetical protein CPB86DRAFT_796836 [Serendipita vermifera]
MDGRFVDEKNGAVEARSSPIFPLPPPSVIAHPAWMSSESSTMRKKQRFRRAAIFTTGGLMVVYLLLCTWIAYERTNYGDSSMEGRFPWPFPRHPHKRPHPHPPPHHPHHPFPHPVPNVLGCKVIPTPSDDSGASVKLDVTIPKWRPVAFPSPFLGGNVSIAKIPEEKKSTEESVEVENWMEEDLSEGKEITVHITVVNRTEPKFPHPHPPHRVSEDGEMEDVMEEESEEDKGFLLCALSLSFPHHPPPPPPEFEGAAEGAAEGDVLMHPPHPLPHRRPPPPVVSIGIFPAHNETYPKFPFPGPPGHPPHSLPPHHPHMHSFEGTSYGSHRSTFKGALRSIVSFLFPMFSATSSEQGQFHPHHPPTGPPPSGHRCHHGPPHHLPPPPPPFEVVALEAAVPASVPVLYGLPPPPFFFHPPPPHHPPHGPPFSGVAASFD